MAREDLIASAISFLQDPSVAVAPLEKRKAFLESKNLTQEEIEIALSRVGEDVSYMNTPPAGQTVGGFQAQQLPPRFSQNYNYGPYQGGSYPPGPWAQQPPEPPRRDWRDWFIMATITSGVGYGLYALGKRYVAPLISPPTPAQLETDKSEIDASFTRAFTLIDQLATDTTHLKDLETERTAKLDGALSEVQSVILDLKAANQRREDEGKRIGEEVRSLKEMIPRALEGWKSEGDGRLKELGSELKSLKMLLGNRVGGGSGSQGQATRSSASASSNVLVPGRDSSIPSPTPESQFSRNGTLGTRQEQEDKASPSGGSVGKRDSISAGKAEPSEGAAAAPQSRPSNRAAIPAWQMAAAGKSKAPAGGNNGNQDWNSSEMGGEVQRVAET